MELYEERVKEKGKRKADLNFIIDVLLLFRPGIIRPAEGHQNLNTYGMYKSYFKIGWRNLLRNKGYSLINIGGLAIGMMVAILNGLWIWHEFSFNKYFDNYDRIALISEGGLNLEEGGYWVGTTMTYPLGTELINQHKQDVKHFVRAADMGCIFSSGDTKISVNGMYADKEAPELFTFKMLQGTRAGLANTHSILISASTAIALFGREDVIDRTLRMDNMIDVTITGVYEDFPQNTQLENMQFFAPWDLYLIQNKWIEERAATDWRNHFIKIYVEVLPGQTFESTKEKLKSTLKFDPQDQEMATKIKRELYLYPMAFIS